MAQPTEPTFAYVALGANLGDRERNIRRALSKLSRSAGVRVVRVSDIIQTEADGGPADSPPYLNAVARVDTTLPARALLKRLLEIEKELGRVRRVQWEPRLIDLDVLLYGNELFSSDELIVPHPLLHTRLFVLIPLAQIAPKVMHPVLNQSAADLLAALRAGQRVVNA